MSFRLSVIFILFALSTVVEAAASSFSSAADVTWGLSAVDGGALVGELVDPAEEAMMESEAARRTLWGARRAISYGALSRNRVPCSRRGRSYYNCRGSGRANPYRRGCSAITRCARFSG